jgi:hypothetical protein
MNKNKIKDYFNARVHLLEETESPLSIEERLSLVGLTLQKVMTFAYKEAVKTLNTEFKPVDKAMEPYRFKIPYDDLISAEEE